jgi:general secretion pathway protein D
MSGVQKALRAWLLGAALSLAGTVGSAEDTQVTLNFVNADIESVIKAVSQVSGRNFIIDPRVKGTINIISGKPVPRTLAYQVLVSALRLQGYAVVESPTITKVVPEADAKIQPGPLVGKGGTAGEQVVTQVFQVRYESAAQLAGALKPLVSPNQTISSYPNSNALVITDTADNLRRLENVIAAIDVPHGEDPQVMTLQHASAVDVAATLNKLFAPTAQQVLPGQAPRTLTVVAEPRTNRIVVRTDDPSLLVRARALVSELDQPSSGAGNIHVVYLKHADATRVAQTLRAILGGTPGTSPGTVQASAVVPAPAQMQMQPFQASSGMQNNIPSFQNAQQDPGALQAGSMIQADPSTNSLIVIAPESVYRNLRNVIDMLDKRRAQVYIEALVVELTADKAAEFGIQWQDLTGLGGNKLSLIGGTNFGAAGQNIVGVAKSPGSIGKGLNIGIVKGTVNIPGLGAITNLGLLARFLESENNANILSTPNILTLDNEEAKIIIGQNVPFVTGSYTNTGTAGGAVNPFQTYERKDVGLTLKVKPQITEGGVVRVQIYQEASSVQPGTATNANGPVTNKRSLESHVLVDDGSIVALGGLIEDSYGTGEDRVPFLGDAPLVGGLFRYETKSRKKTNLMVFLRPHIVRDREGYQDLSRSRYEQMQQGQRNFAETSRGWMSESEAPILPSLKMDGRPAGIPAEK